MAIPSILLVLSFPYTPSSPSGLGTHFAPNRSMVRPTSQVSVHRAAWDAGIAQARNASLPAEDRARAVIQSIDRAKTIFPREAIALADEVRTAGWIEGMNPVTRAKLRLRLAECLGLGGKWSEADPLAASAESAPGLDAEVRARADVYAGLSAYGAGNVVKQTAVLSRLTGVWTNTALSADLRLEAATLLLRIQVELGLRPAPEILLLCQRTLDLAGTSTSEAAMNASVVAQNTRVPLIRDMIVARDPAAALEAPRMRQAIATEFSQMRDWFWTREQGILSQFGNESRAYGSWLRAAISVGVQVQTNDSAALTADLARFLQAAEGASPWFDPITRGIMKIQVNLRLERTAEAQAAYTGLAAALATMPPSDRVARVQLATLPLLAETDPVEAARRWRAAISRFTTSQVGVAQRDPDEALRLLGSWNAHWAMYEAFPKAGLSESFIEGYLEATGVIRNLPYTSTQAAHSPSEMLQGVSLADVQSRLSPSQPMVVYVRFTEPNKEFAEGVSYAAFVLDGQSVRYQTLGAGMPIENAIERWDTAMNGDAQSITKLDPQAEGRKLYDAILKPVFPNGVPARMIVVPDEKIGLVSFAGLQSPSKRWLVENCAVTYMGAMRDIARRPLASVGASQILSATQFKTLRSSELGAPKRVALELAKLDRRTDSGPLDASVGAKLKRPKFLHISSHGGFDFSLSSDPAIVARASYILSPAKKEDVRITARDVAKWDLRGTKLVTLAVCESGKAAMLRGDGTGGLRRAFYLAGARQVVSSLRYVYPSPTEKAPGDRLISLVYRKVRQGQSPGDALRSAQREFLRQPATAHPSHWATFICEGTP